MALNLGNYRIFKALGMDPKGTFQQELDSYVWSADPAAPATPDATAPAVNDTQSPNVYAKIGHTYQSMWLSNNPEQSGLAVSWSGD